VNNPRNDSRECLPTRHGKIDSVLVRPFSPPAATWKPQSDSDDGMSDGTKYLLTEEARARAAG